MYMCYTCHYVCGRFVVIFAGYENKLRICVTVRKKLVVLTYKPGPNGGFEQTVSYYAIHIL